MVYIEPALEAAVRRGALFRHKVLLEEGELAQRRLWFRPEIATLLKPGRLAEMQRQRVLAALRRFVVGGRFTVVRADCQHREVENLGDIRELKGQSPPFVELRFKPPEHDLRLFGRFVGKDNLLLTTFGMKSLTGTTGQRRLSIAQERNRCDRAFKAAELKVGWVTTRIEDSISNASFI